MRLNLRYIAATVIILVIIIVFSIVLNRPESRRALDSISQKDSLTVAIGFRRSLFSTEGFSIGFHYEFLNQLGEDVGKEVKILPPYSNLDYWELLLNNEIDIIAIDISDSIPRKYSEYIMRSIASDGYALVVNKVNPDFLKSIDLWKSGYIVKPEYRELKRKYFKSYHISSNLKNFTHTHYISPYDNNIKKYSSKIGWDWKLLAALIYQESRFSMYAKSPRGAIGLMQIKPSTAKSYGITQILDPENNIKAGALHLKRLKQLYLKKGMDSINVIKFTLASYNAGESRIRDCMNFTKAQDNNHLDWEEVAKTIPLMSIPKYYKNANLRHGKFKGTETINYVHRILSKYEYYKFAVQD